MFVVLSPQSFFKCEPRRFGRIILFALSRDQFFYSLSVIQSFSATVHCHLFVAKKFSRGCVALLFSVFHTLFTAAGRICTDPGVRFVPFVFNLKAGFHMIADDRGSQIADRRKFCDRLRSYGNTLLRSSAIVCDPAIVIADDRRR